MLAETLGVSIETARAVADGDFVVDREHDADMAWTSAPITPHTADETLAQLAKTPALPALPMTPGAVDSNLFVGAVCGRVCERVFVQPYLNEVALARDNLEWLASYLHPDAFVDQAAILLESVEDLEVPSREERFERRFGALLRFCLESRVERPVVQPPSYSPPHLRSPSPCARSLQMAPCSLRCSCECVACFALTHLAHDHMLCSRTSAATAPARSAYRVSKRHDALLVERVRENSEVERQ
jgi:hypothetical protein